MPIHPSPSTPGPRGGTPQSLKNINQLIDALNKDFSSGNTGIEFSFVPNENNADQGEIWIMRGPSKSDPNKKRTGKIGRAHV